MNSAAIRSNRRKLLVLAAIVLLCAAGYMLVGVNFSNPKLFAYAMKIRTPKLVVMLITAFSIGGASLVFQSIINNTIVTPCLLGMNSLYTLIHTAVVFFLGSASIVSTNANLSFGVDVVLMGITATIIYSWIFQKTKHNVLYVLLVGTVLTSFFSSIQTTLTRVMDPNEYDTLLNTLVASFSNINSEIILFSLVLLAGVIFALRKELAINLGVDYDRCIRIPFFIRALNTALILLLVSLAYHSFMMFRNGVKSLSDGFALSTLLLMAMKRTPFLGKTTSV